MGVVNSGLNTSADRTFGINGPPAVVGFLFICSDTNAVTAATNQVIGASPGTGNMTLSTASQNGVIKAFSPAASRAGQVMTAGATFTQADYSANPFIIAKVGQLNANPDVAGSIFDIIGGTGGAAPFNQPFSIDLRNVTTWTLTLQIQTTFANS